MTSYPAAPAGVPSGERRRPASHWTDWGKWLALISMSVDHVTRFALPAAWPLGWASDTVGRVAFPLFAAMVAWHALFDTRNPWRYARRIVMIGLVAQLPYMLMPRVLSMPVLNVCFTLALGLIVGSALLRLAQQPPRTLAMQIAAMLMVLFACMLALLFEDLFHVRLEYGWTGVLLIPVFMLVLHLAARADGLQRLLILPATGLLALVAWPLNIVPISQWIALMTCLLVTGLALGGAQHVPALPRRFVMPRVLWLGWYPGHLALIALWVVLSGR
ncbi:TraX family protein [Kushneria phosphatilytica]|uniref:TraX n=1 Tax=Kushneria phosphatilytica TaxID=657387 RepID=A0A5C1A2F1_9GAMM|nr:TraX family protein [Kushneria phosphatilytica]QEL12336.1 TraX [Kushneria phosphatilytica]